MKDIKLYSLLVCLCLLMQSCLFSEDDVFDQSSAQRAIASVNECREVLESAENGWALKYYTGEDGVYGGFNIFAKFEGEYVTLASEVATPNYEVGEYSTSLFKVNSFQGTELSFDSHNELIHIFCEPNGYNDPGYAGDYEFIFRSLSKDKIVLTGKKHGVTLVMTPISAGVDWKTELTKIAVLAEDAAYNTFNLMINGKEVVRMGRSERAFTITTTDGAGQMTSESYPFIYTSDGAEMLDPLIVNGVEMSHFRWDSQTATYTCVDDGVDAKIVFYCPEGYPKYVGNYILQSDEGAVNCKLEEKRKGATYSMKLTVRSVPIELVFDYNQDTDCIDVLSQIVGKINGFDLYFYPGYGTSLYPYAGVGFNGKVSVEDPMTITFIYNNNNPSVNTILFIYSNNGYYLAGSITNPVLIKQD